MQSEKRTFAWILAGTVAVLVSGYLALTVGAAVFLPEEMAEIEPGMTRESAVAMLENFLLEPVRGWYGFDHEILQFSLSQGARGCDCGRIASAMKTD